MTTFIASPMIATVPADAIGMATLVILLALKVVVRSGESPFARTLNRLLIAGIVPLLILFAIRVLPGFIMGLIESF